MKQRTLKVAISPPRHAFLSIFHCFFDHFFVTKNTWQKKREKHRSVMLSAFFTSALFLVSYVIYHWFKSGPKPYLGELGFIYYPILITHIILAMLILPLAMITLYRGWVVQIQAHRKIARITFPIWMYVSVTGIIIYVMLYL